MVNQTAADVWRDYDTANVPASGAHKPDKREIRAWGAFMETLLAGVGPGLGYETRALAIADIAHAANTLALVYSDPTPAYNGLYQKYGVSGAGSWTRVGDLPNGIVRLTITAGTANAIIATASETPVVPGSKLYLMTIAATNTGAVALTVNGGAAVSVVSAFGLPLVEDSLLIGSQVLMAWNGTAYQLLISANVDASGILAAAVAAAAAAADSATDSAGSASTSEAHALTAGAAAARFVRLATTANHGLTGLTAIDGVTPVAADKVLVKSNTAPAENGIYVAAAGAWSRATDFNDSTEVKSGIVVHVSEGTANKNKKFVSYSPTDPVVVGTSSLTFAETSLIGDADQMAFQQAGAGTVPLPVMQVLREWHTLTMYGGGADKTAAQNAAAFVAARDVLRTGGTLTVPPGTYACDPVAWIKTDGTYTHSMIIEGTANPSGPADNHAVIYFSGTGAGKFWDFDAPAAGPASASRMTVRNLYFYASSAAFSGALVSSSTPVTDGSKITDGFTLENSVLAAVSESCTLLDIGKTIITTVIGNHFGGGGCQIKGQQGQTVAGIAQARQSTTVDVRKNTFIGCNGYPILYGGEAWGLYDNIFEGTKDGRGRAFSTNSNYPIRNMTWINNWFGDFGPGNPVGDQMILVHGIGFVFIGNYVGGAWQGSGNGWNAIFMDGVKGFQITGNTFDYCSAAISSGGAVAAPDYGFIEGNVLNTGVISGGTFGASTRIANNGI